MIKKINTPKTVRDLSQKLDVSEIDLRSIIAKKARFYSPTKKTLKKDGSPRDAYLVLQPLKSLHLKIKESIFDEINYPFHLHGGLRGRSIVTNAKIHLNAKSLIVMDIKNFFPSITKKHVANLFKKWGYSKDASIILADILTLDNKLPQGMSVGSALANLMISGEGGRVKKLEQRGIRYSRFIDDIALSSAKEISAEEMKGVEKCISDMITAMGFSINQGKTRVYNESISDKNDEMFMVIAGVNVSGESPAIATCYYNALEKTIRGISRYGEYDETIRGAISHVKFIDPAKGNKLKRLLSQVRLEISPQNRSLIMTKTKNAKPGRGKDYGEILQH